MDILKIYKEEKLVAKIEYWPSDNEPYTEGCDCVIGYNVYDLIGNEIDGGELDFDSSKYNSESAINKDDALLASLVEFAIGYGYTFKKEVE